jgi:hypothetical protein
MCKVYGLASYSYVADRRNKRVTTDYGYLNYTFTVIWLIVYTVGLPVHILTLRDNYNGSQTLFIAAILYVISSYTGSIVSVVWVSVIKRKMFLKIIEGISQVDNKLQYTLQDETCMNRNVLFNIISEIILVTVLYCPAVTYHIYSFASEPYYVSVIRTIISFSNICNSLILFQFLNLVFMVKQRYSHLNKRLTNWINGTVNRPIRLMNENERSIQSYRDVDHGIKTTVYVSSVGIIEGTLSLTDIHLLRQIYSELYDITCLINDTYGIPILVTMCWMLTFVLCNLYSELINSELVELTDAAYTGMCLVLFFKLTLFCHTATNKARSASILVQKLLLKGNCRNECVNQLKMFSLQLQIMKTQYTACGFFSLNLRLFASVVSVIASYIIIMVQVK